MSHGGTDIEMAHRNRSIQNNASAPSWHRFEAIILGPNVTRPIATTARPIGTQPKKRDSPGFASIWKYSRGYKTIRARSRQMNTKQ